jgi:uncharacterized coiled-coil protein SlyX
MNENTKFAIVIAINVVIVVVFALFMNGTVKSQRKQCEATQARIEKVEQEKASKDDAIRKLGTEVVELQTRLDRQTAALRNTLISLDRFMTAQAAAAKPAVHTNAPAAVSAKVPAKASKKR